LRLISAFELPAAASRENPTSGLRLRELASFKRPTAGTLPARDSRPLKPRRWKTPKTDMALRVLRGGHTCLLSLCGTLVSNRDGTVLELALQLPFFEVGTLCGSLVSSTPE
jgi:hypothetical protein